MMTTRLNVLAMLSTGVLAVLLCGYAAVFGARMQYSSPAATAPSYRSTTAILGEGRVSVSWITDSIRPSPFFSGRRWAWSFHPRLPSLRRSLWEFDVHPIPSPAGIQAYMIGFPIWLAALPFTIAPALWLKRRPRERAAPRGFSVELTNSTAPLSATN